MKKKLICMMMSLSILFLAGCGHSGDVSDKCSEIQSSTSDELREDIENIEKSVLSEEDTQEKKEKNGKVVIKKSKDFQKISIGATMVQNKRMEQTYFDKEGTELVETVCEYPCMTIASNKQLEKKLNQYFQQEWKNLLHTAQQLRNYAIEDRDYMSEDELNYWAPYNASEQSYVVRNDTKILSIITEYSEYDGRDAIYSERKAMNYDIEQTENLTIQDIVEQTDIFYQIAEKERKENLKQTKSYSIRDIFREDNWYMGEDGIVILENTTNELGEDVDNTEILLSYDKLQKCLKKKYLP